MVGKKKSRGGSRGGGRPQGDKPLDGMTEEENKEYRRGLKASSRNQSITPKKRSERYPGASTSSASASLASPSARRGPGRPPASPSGPRTPRTRSRLAGETMSKSRRKKYLSGVRAAAANKRHHGDEKLLQDSEEDESELETKEVVPKKLKFGETQEKEEGDIEDKEEENVKEPEKTNRTLEKPHGQMSKATYFRKLAEVKDVFENQTNSWQEKIDVGINLLARSDLILNTDRMGVTINEENYLMHKNRNFSLNSNRRINRKANKVREVLETTMEPEILLEDLLLSTILNMPNTSFLMQEEGVVVEESLQPRFQVVSRKYQSVMAGLVSGRHVSKGQDRFLANK